MTQAPLRILLGPQNPERNLGDAFAQPDVPSGSVAVISAAWQEAENDINELGTLVGRPLVDLEVYRRAQDVFSAEAELAEAYRARQGLLQEQQRLYHMRLRPLAIAARRVLRLEGDAETVEAEQRHAVAQLRSLDRHHLQRTDAIQRTFSDQYDFESNSALARHRDEMRQIVEDSAAVLITGGNVAVLINRLRLFGLADVLAPATIVAWSAGAMVLASRIVLFHERMPQGRREPEVFCAGLGLTPNYLFMPDTKRRLRSKDKPRTGLMARRFSPDTCVALDNGTLLALAGDRIRHSTLARRLLADGGLGRLRAT